MEGFGFKAVPKELPLRPAEAESLVDVHAENIDAPKIRDAERAHESTLLILTVCVCCLCVFKRGVLIHASQNIADPNSYGNYILGFPLLFGKERPLGVRFSFIINAFQTKTKELKEFLSVS